MTPADRATQDEIRAEWAGLSRPQRRRAIRALGIFAAVELAGIEPASVVLALNGPVERADATVRRDLDNVRTFLRPQ